MPAQEKGQYRTKKLQQGSVGKDKQPEAEFMNVQFRRVSGHNLESSQT